MMPPATEHSAIGCEIAPVTFAITSESIAAYSRYSNDARGGCEACHGRADNALEDRSGLARAAAQSSQLVAYLSELALAYFGAGWVRGGRLDLSLIKPVYAGDSITVRGIVCDFRAVAGGTRIALDVWMESQTGERIAAGWISGMAQPQCLPALNVRIALPPAAGTHRVESRIQA